MRTPKQRGPFGNWLQAERTRRYATQRAALADMRRLAGLHISESEFAQWESGSRVPHEDNPKVRALYDFFGSQPNHEPEPTPVLAHADEVAAAIDRQTAVFAQLLEAAQAQAIAAERRADLLERVVISLLAPAAGRAADPAAIQVMREWGRAALESMQSPQPEADPVPRGEG